MEIEAVGLLKTIEGLVTACDWDERGKPLQLKVCAPDERDYYVAKTPGGKKLFKCLKNWVEVTGEIVLDGNKEIIKIKKINKQDYFK